MVSDKEFYSLQKNLIPFHMHALQARLEIRDFFLNNTVKEIYENVGQVLSTVRMQIATLKPATSEIECELEILGNLIGRSIQDLRIMSRLFFPEEALLKKEGLTNTLKQTLHILGYQCPVITKGIETTTEFIPEVKLMTFNLLLKVLLSFKEYNEHLQQITISRYPAFVTYRFTWLASVDTVESCAQLSLEKLHTIGGTYSIKKTPNETEIISFKVPYNFNYYEQG